VVLNPTYGFSQESPLHLNLEKRSIRKETRRMICPFCRHDDSRVVDSRPADDGSQIRRRRECTECGARFTTQETTLLNIVKRSGASEPFSREKVIAGVSKACQGRPVNDDDLALLAMRVEETLRATGQAEIEAQEVGLAILAPLRELDEVAYLRFASVYRSFSSLEDFEGEIALLRAAPSTPASKSNTAVNTPEKVLTAPSRTATPSK
jgi:transcriptional repressor NrdR